MATLTSAEYEYAINLDYEKLPNRLRCAVCNKAVVDAMKTECCDTVMCGPCAAKLTGTCPVCEYTGSPDEMTREDKRTRTTLKAHIKGELQKINNAAAAAAKEAEAKLEAEQVAPTPDAVETLPEQEQILVSPEQPLAVEEPVQEAGQHGNAGGNEVQEPMDEELAEDDVNDDKSDIEIITERPELEQQQSFNNQDQGEADVTDQEPYNDHDTQRFDQNVQQNMAFDPQSFMNFATMNGFNPMMAMQTGMMPPFGIMPNMMGMPNMNMDPSMMFNGGFGGMGGMMNGGMMMPGMGDMNDFNPYNSQQYGNRFDNRFSHPSNRGSGRGFAGQDYRGRGRGFYRGGRGRGGWQQHQSYHQQDFNHQQGYQQDYDSNNTTDYPAEPQHAQDTRELAYEQDATTEKSSHADATHIEHHDDSEQVETKQNGHDQNGSHDHRSERHASEAVVQSVAPPINAPTGPRAMREGLPNSGRFSRPHASIEESRPVSRDFNPPSGPSAQRHSEAPRERDDARSDYKRRTASRSRSPVERKRERSRTPRKDGKDDREDKHKRRDRKREREYDDDHRNYDKKRSRSGTPDEDYRRHRHRDDGDRSRRDKSREKLRNSHRSRDKENDYDRRKSRSHKSRRDREDKYGDDYEQEAPARQARPVLEEPQDDIGFKIKGTKSGNNAVPTGPAVVARGDPYAEEREKMREQRLQRDAERRQGTNGKRGRDESNGDDSGYKKRRSKPRAKYEDEIGDHEQERERARWR